MDPNNPVVKLCVAGMQAENEGRSADAKALFEQAWAEAQDDFDACIAAHYVARHQLVRSGIVAGQKRTCPVVGESHAFE